MAYIETVYETWSWKSNIASRLSTQTDVMVILMNLLNPIARTLQS